MFHSFGRIAQSVEQRTENPCVAGSIPVPANKFRRNFFDGKKATVWLLSGIEVKHTCVRTGFRDDEVARKDSQFRPIFFVKKNLARKEANDFASAWNRSEDRLRANWLSGRRSRQKGFTVPAEFTAHLYLKHRQSDDVKVLLQSLQQLAKSHEVPWVMLL